MINIKLQIHSSWRRQLSSEFKKKYFYELEIFLNNERRNNTIFPKKNDIFNALKICTFNNLKVVIIGQDPYHSKKQAHGLAFSVNNESSIPPSLRNIFKELIRDTKCEIPSHGNLTKWAKQGVLLLNTILTVRENQAGSHKNKGWELFTNKIIEKISEEKKNIVFLLWGKYAENKKKLIDRNKHHILITSHPSPLSAHNGFIGCKHFTKTNKLLKNNKIKTINWKV